MSKFENFLRNDLGVKSYEAISVEPYYYGDDRHYSLSYWTYWPNGRDMGDYSTIGPWERFGFRNQRAIPGSSARSSTKALKGAVINKNRNDSQLAPPLF